MGFKVCCGICQPERLCGGVNFPGATCAIIKIFNYASILVFKVFEGVKTLYFLPYVLHPFPLIGYINQFHTLSMGRFFEWGKLRVSVDIL